MENWVNNIAANFISSKNVDEERVMHSKSDNIELMWYDIANMVVNELFESLLSRYQISLETSMRAILFSIQSNCCLINVRRGIFERGGSYIDSPNWIKKKKTTKFKNEMFSVCGNCCIKW